MAKSTSPHATMPNRPGRPAITDREALLTERLVVLMSRQEKDRLTEFQHDLRMRSLGEAVRVCIARQLERTSQEDAGFAARSAFRMTPDVFDCMLEDVR